MNTGSSILLNSCGSAMWSESKDRVLSEIKGKNLTTLSERVRLKKFYDLPSSISKERTEQSLVIR